MDIPQYETRILQRELKKQQGQTFIIDRVVKSANNEGITLSILAQGFLIN